MSPIQDAYERLQAARSRLPALRQAARTEPDAVAELNRQHYVIAGIEADLIRLKNLPAIGAGPSECP
jgi:hypothetical protein